MSDDITIPPEAVEAAVQAWLESASDYRLLDDSLRAAIRAALMAWPGMECTGPSGGGVSQEPRKAPRIILPCRRRKPPMIDDGLPPGDPKDHEITRLRAENDLLRAALSNIRHKRREMDMGDLSADEAVWEADAIARAALTQGEKQ